MFRSRSKKFSKKVDELYIPKTKSIVISGMHHSGKTRELNKLFESKETIFKQTNFVRIQGQDPFSDWYNQNIKKDDQRKFVESFKDQDDQITAEADIRKQHIKIHNLIHRTTKSVLFVDDIDQVSGKKKETLKDLIRVSTIVICTCKDIKELDKTLSTMLYRMQYTEISLKSDTSYDATNILFVMMVLGMLATGNPALAVLVMAGRYALKGKDKK